MQIVCYGVKIDFNNFEITVFVALRHIEHSRTSHSTGYDSNIACVLYVCIWICMRMQYIRISVSSHGLAMGYGYGSY